jgi:hypothetical protein
MRVQIFWYSEKPRHQKIEYGTFSWWDAFGSIITRTALAETVEPWTQTQP